MNYYSPAFMDLRLKLVHLLRELLTAICQLASVLLMIAYFFDNAAGRVGKIWSCGDETKRQEQVASSPDPTLTQRRARAGHETIFLR